MEQKPRPVRLETGLLQANQDWTGLYIRGDDCLRLAVRLRQLLDIFNTDTTVQAITAHEDLRTLLARELGEFQSLLDSVNVRPEIPVFQKVKFP